jgi:hypothetical protein
MYFVAGFLLCDFYKTVFCLRDWIGLVQDRNLKRTVMKTGIVKSEQFLI